MSASRSGRRWRGAAEVGLITAAMLVGSAPAAHGQLAAPCEVRCAAALGVSVFTVATGTATVAGRAVGGFSTMGEGAMWWGIGFGVGMGSAIALSGDGRRQERAAYASNVGLLVGGLAGFGYGAATASEAEPTRWAATLIGAAAGALAGGLYGVLSYDAPATPEGVGAPPAFLFAFGLPIG